MAEAAVQRTDDERPIGAPPSVTCRRSSVASRLHHRVVSWGVKKDNKAGASSSAAKPAKTGSGKQQQKKKKWSKGKQKEKLNNAVLFDQPTYDKMLSEAPKYKLVTPSVLSERLKINVSLAKRGIKDLIARGLVREVSLHASQQIFTRATNVPSS
ncbi:40S ribosomal protein S25-2 [Hordeum vulgare]|nr:40S ribosomal protein S25-2 [Hordeum vulgare]